MGERRSALRRFTAPLCALLLLVGVTLLPQVEIKPRMKVALSVWPGSEGLVLARDASWLPQDRIRVVELPWASAVSRTFDDDMVDVAVLTLDGVLQLREGGQRLRVLQVMDQSTGGDAVLARPEIQNLEGLKDKRVGVDVFGVGMYLLVNALEHAGMTLKDVQIVPLIQPEIDSMFQSGSIDAAVAAEPWLTQVRGKGMHRLYGSEELETPIYRMLVASEKACTSFQEELTALVRATAVVTRQVRSGKEFDGMQAILRREKVTLENFVQNLQSWQPLDLAQNREMLAGPQPKLDVLARRVETQMLRHGLLRAPLEPAKWIDPQFLGHTWE